MVCLVSFSYYSFSSSSLLPPWRCEPVSVVMKTAAGERTIVQMVKLLLCVCEAGEKRPPGNIWEPEFAAKSFLMILPDVFPSFHLARKKRAFLKNRTLKFLLAGLVFLLVFFSCEKNKSQVNVRINRNKQESSKNINANNILLIMLIKGC